MTAEGFDVAIVPDFTRRATVFEARTLFFLAAWAENAGASRGFPLHIACIGEPPLSVLYEAERCGAAISVHEPVGIGSVMSNKFRAFEANLQTDHLALLDVDILVLDDISGLAQFAGSVAAQPIGKPPLRMRDWRAVYKIVGLDVPTERISSMLGDLLDPALEHLRAPEQNRKLREMVPMFHGGVVFTPLDVGLRQAWEDAYRAVSENFLPEDSSWNWVRKNDEVPLAIAVEKLKGRGVAFARLPDMYHAQWPHMWGRYHWGDPKLFHLMGFLRQVEDTSSPHTLAQQIREYCKANRDRHLEGDNRFKRVVQQDPESFIGFTNELETELLNLLDARVAPALEKAAAAPRVL